MQTDNRFFDDMARAAGGALGVLSGARSEVEGMVRQQLERMMAQMDLVPREEFEAVRDMARKAREDQETLAARVAELETRLEKAESAKKSASASSSSSSTRAKSTGGKSRSSGSGSGAGRKSGGTGGGAA